MHIQLGRSD